jgi:hypothetical protein
MVLSGLDQEPWSARRSRRRLSFGRPVTAWAEDCRGTAKGRSSATCRKTTIRRSVIAFSFDAEAHNQGYYTGEFDNSTTFDEVIFYRNGYKSDPRVDPDPRRDIFSRNIYQGGGSMLGHRYLGIISADGASGGPQMRLGGDRGKPDHRGVLVQRRQQQHRQPLAVRSDSPALGRGGTTCSSCTLPTSTPTRAAGPPRLARLGLPLHAASFGACRGNIISQAMLADDLGVAEGAGLRIPETRPKRTGR